MSIPPKASESAWKLARSVTCGDRDEMNLAAAEFQKLMDECDAWKGLATGHLQTVQICKDQIAQLDARIDSELVNLADRVRAAEKLAADEVARADRRLMRAEAAERKLAACPSTCPPTELDTRWQELLRWSDEQMRGRQEAERKLAELVRLLKEWAENTDESICDDIDNIMIESGAVPTPDEYDPEDGNG